MTVAKAGRRRLTAEARREQILDVTHAIVAADGFHAATPGRIAAEAGVTRPVLYQQFGDLAGLFVALVDREADRAAAQFAGIVAAMGDDTDLGEVFETVLAALDEAPDTWRIFLLPPQGAPVELHERLAASEARVREFLQAALLRRRPGLRDPEYAAHVVHATGATLLRLRLVDPAATHERILAMLRDLRSVAG